MVGPCQPAPVLVESLAGNVVSRSGFKRRDAGCSQSAAASAFLDYVLNRGCWNLELEKESREEALDLK